LPEQSGDIEYQYGAAIPEFGGARESPNLHQGVGQRLHNHFLKPDN
jgi:hypothetical protein